MLLLLLPPGNKSLSKLRNGISMRSEAAKLSRKVANRKPRKAKMKLVSLMYDGLRWLKVDTLITFRLMR